MRMGIEILAIMKGKYVEEVMITMYTTGIVKFN